MEREQRTRCSPSPDRGRPHERRALNRNWPERFLPLPGSGRIQTNVLIIKQGRNSHRHPSTSRSRMAAAQGRERHDAPTRQHGADAAHCASGSNVNRARIVWIDNDRGNGTSVESRTAGMREPLESLLFQRRKCNPHLLRLEHRVVRGEMCYVCSAIDR